MNPGPKPEPSFPHLITSVTDAYRISKAFKAEAPPQAPPVVRLHVLRNYSAEYLEPFVTACFNRAGLGCQVSFGGYNTMHQELLATEDKAPGASDLGTSDLVVLSLTLDGLIPDWRLGGFSVAEVIATVTGLAELALQHTAAPVVLNSFLRPVLDSGGLAASLDPDAADWKIAEINHGLRHYAAGRTPRVLLVDWERLAMMLGVERSLDARIALIAAAPFRHDFLGAYAHELFKIGRALKGLSKKCLILDCDNTLWGGIVGEAGLEGIALDRQGYPGRAFYDFQTSVVRLAARGVMIGLCSKNNADDVFAVLEHHPHCLLKRDHLVGWRIDWAPKEQNIAALVRELNIGLEAVVFVDDSPMECARVSAFLPEVTVRQVPAELFRLPVLLDQDGLFDTLTTTNEDRQRTPLYQAEARRHDSARTFASPEAFLASLALTAKIAPVSPGQVARVAQLTQKTNQFNLTTRRYPEAEIARMAADANWAVFAMVAGDRFGDLGLSAVLIARRDGTAPDLTVHVDTLLLSCRILGRSLEHAFVVSCFEQLAACWQPRHVTAEYRPTAKNHQVADFWPAFGLAESPSPPDLARNEPNSRWYQAEWSALKLEPVHFITVTTTACHEPSPQPNPKPTS